MKELRIIVDDARILQGLLDDADERCAVLLTRQVSRQSAVTSLAYDVIVPRAMDYTRVSPLEAELSPDFVATVTKRARSESAGLVFVHTHTGAEPPNFSLTDDMGEERLAEFLHRRHPGADHGAIVISSGGMRARELGKTNGVRVVSVGRTQEVLFDPEEPKVASTAVHDRQIRALGLEAQATLESLRVAIVGLGGTGSLVAQEIAHLGVTKFTLIDPDVIDTSNLNRVANAAASDIGRPKIDVAASYIGKTQEDSEITKIRGSVLASNVAHALVDADVIFACTDSHGSRAVIQQVAYQYLIPCIDVGVVITLLESNIRYVFGRIQLLAPGLACLICSGLLDSDEVRQDMMTDYERQQDSYILGAAVPAPAVMALNGTVSSLAVTMLLSTFVEFPAKGRHWLYDALTPRLRSVEAVPENSCYICSRMGALAKGDTWPLFARSQ